MLPAEQTYRPMIARNTLYNLIGQGVPLVIAVIAMPFVIRGLGVERFGILALTWVILGYFNVFDLGLGRAATKFVAEALSSDDVAGIDDITSTVLLTQTALGSLGALLLMLGTPLLVEVALKVPASLTTEALSALYIVAVAIPLVFISGTLQGVLEAAQRFDLVNAVRSPAIASNYLLPLLAVLLGWKLPGVIALLVVYRLVTVTVLYVLCVRVFPSLRSLTRFQPDRLRRIIRFGGWVTVSSIVNPLLVYLDRLLIGVMISMAAVTYYTAPYEAVTRLSIIHGSLVATLFPAFSTLKGSGREGDITGLFTDSVKYLLLIIGPILILLTGFAREILQVWLGGRFAAESTLLLQLLATGVLINAVANVPFAMLQGTGRPDLTAKFHLIELPLHLAALYLGISLWGITGAALAWSLRAAIDAVLLFAAAGRLSATPVAVFLSEGIIQTLALFFAGCLAVMALSQLLPGAFLRTLLVLGVFAACCGSVWFFCLTPRDRDRLARLGSVLRHGGDRS